MIYADGVKSVVYNYCIIYYIKIIITHARARCQAFWSCCHYFRRFKHNCDHKMVKGNKNKSVLLRHNKDKRGEDYEYGYKNVQKIRQSARS